MFGKQTSSPEFPHTRINCHRHPLIILIQHRNNVYDVLTEACIITLYPSHVLWIEGGVEVVEEEGRSSCRLL